MSKLKEKLLNRREKLLTRLFNESGETLVLKEKLLKQTNDLQQQIAKYEEKAHILLSEKEKEFCGTFCGLELDEEYLQFPEEEMKKALNVYVHQMLEHYNKKIEVNKRMIARNLDRLNLWEQQSLGSPEKQT